MPSARGGASTDCAGEREDGLAGLFGGKHEGQQDARGVLAPVARIFGIVADGKGEGPEVVLGVCRGSGIEPVDGSGGAQDVDGTEGPAPAGGLGVGVGLEVVDDRATIPGEQLRGGPQPFAEAGGGD
jgi:hypothetical protein